MIMSNYKTNRRYHFNLIPQMTGYVSQSLYLMVNNYNYIKTVTQPCIRGVRVGPISANDSLGLIKTDQSHARKLRKLSVLTPLESIKPGIGLKHVNCYHKLWLP